MSQHVDVRKRVTIFFLSLFFVYPLTAAEIVLEKKSPFVGTATLSNSVGVGTFVSGYARVPSLSSSLTIYPGYVLPAFAGLPPMRLSAMASLTGTWLNSYITTVFNAHNRVIYSDVLLTLSAPRILNLTSIGFSLSPDIDLIVPISKMSRALNRMIGLQVNSNLTYQKSDFSVSWLPSFTTWIYSNASMTMPCGDSGSASALPPVINPQNINFDLDQYLQEIVVSRSEERTSDGTCRVVGRQTIGLLSNTLRVTWAPGRHNLSASLGWYLNFLRPLESRPDLHSAYASGRNIFDATMGRITYTYQLPIAFDLSVGGGVMSYQTSYNSRGNFNFPFFDFVTPGKNQTQIFLQLTAGI